MELRTVACAPLCAYTRNVSRAQCSSVVPPFKVFPERWGSPTLLRWQPLTPKRYIWTALDMTWWSGSLTSWIAGLPCLDFFCWGQTRALANETPMSRRSYISSCRGDARHARNLLER
ncbi:hypothetical protein AVEN_259289-1 [Araneus ventricosus]|uniref:Uncharacterized protein n=1 Tax=Araneus ventricosus TaxID=182803 RepID=A0A4Y2GKH4_ARAVE|nr:hypothetical protein AVEN_259289-1 [Araneus ventricosus]